MTLFITFFCFGIIAESHSYKSNVETASVSFNHFPQEPQRPPGHHRDPSPLPPPHCAAFGLGFLLGVTGDFLRLLHVSVILAFLLLSSVRGMDGPQCT